MKKYALYIDHEACWGCKACEVACKQETGAPEGVKLISVQEDGPRVVDGKPYFMFRVNVCRHCDNPPCAKACPEDAITRDPETGIVLQDPEKCTGCKGVRDESGAEKQENSPGNMEGTPHIDEPGYETLSAGRCVKACPYGAMTFDDKNGVARKCNLCHHRVDKGLYPACADNVCLAHCIYFGPPDEIKERIAEGDLQDNSNK